MFRHQSSSSLGFYRWSSTALHPNICLASLASCISASSTLAHSVRVICSRAGCSHRKTAPNSQPDLSPPGLSALRSVFYFQPLSHTHTDTSSLTIGVRTCTSLKANHLNQSGPPTPMPPSRICQLLYSTYYHKYLGKVPTRTYRREECHNCILPPHLIPPLPAPHPPSPISPGAR